MIFRLLGEERKSLMGLSSVLVSVGSMTGGLLLISCKDAVRRTGRSPVIIFGLLAHLAAFTLSLLFLPHLSPLGDKLAQGPREEVKRKHESWAKLHQLS